MAEPSQHGIEHKVKLLAHVLGEEAENEVVVLLEELVFASIPPVPDRVREMLGTVQFDRDARIGAQKIDFHPALTVERNRERDIQTKSPFGFREGLEPPETNASVALRARSTPSASSGNVRAA